MAVSMGKLGKLHAICDRLTKTKEDTDPNDWTPQFQISKKDLPDVENNNIPFSCENSNSCPSFLESPENEKHEEQSFPFQSQSTGRRKRRKAVPRNLAQVSEYLDQFAEEKDELLEYKINNQDADFPPLNSSNEASDEDDKLSSNNENEDCNQSDDGEKLDNDHNLFKNKRSLSNTGCSATSTGDAVSEDIGSDGVLDLSVQKPKNEDAIVKETDTCNEPLEPSQSEENSTSSFEKSQRNSGGVDYAYLQNYAERTMNEFLNMYGFPRDPKDALTNQLALQNFALSKMLPRQKTEMFPGTPIMPHSISASDLALSKRVFSAHAANGLHPNRLPQQNGTIFNKLSNGGGKISYANTVNTPSSSVIQTVMSPDVSIAPPTSSEHLVARINIPAKVVLPDYSKYIRRFDSAQECGGSHCHDMGYREHFHCLDCNFKVFVRKEEMIRHFKWHKKRDDSLQHGFMRYSPMDDCSSEFGACTHNGRQTHYHCLQSGCDKVYISTSDVQMHANYHRKDTAIIQEGFQRFRATEDCGTPSCSFYGQRTTHFHCRRQDCNFTFKNKADMEKHKSYHQKDEMLGRDGFKKFMKYEHCPFQTCRYSKVSNHIHCIRPGCDYVLHSTGQLYSHKRKHERRDFESAYRRFKDNQKVKPGSINKSERPIHPAFSAGAQVPIPRRSTYQSAASAKPFVSNGNGTVIEATIKKESEFIDINHLSRMTSEDNSLSGSTSPVSLSKVETEMKNDLQISVKVEEEEMDDENEDKQDTANSTTGLAAYNDDISGDQLNDSLTLPIPKYDTSTESPQTSPQIVYTPNQSPPKTPLPLAASGLSTPTMLSPAISTPSHSVSSASSTPNRDWATRLSISTDKKPRDESWKAYIERYTANDPCNSRCQYLYKDHYHCKVENCTVLFKSKDAVREHARYHELQERMTSMAYNTYSKYQACSDQCEYNLKEKHYHCIWAGCAHVILDSGPIFNRLEHYRIHEYSRTSAGKTGKASTGSKMESPDFGKRRRGRPPKYPKSEIPVVPKVELSEEELSQVPVGKRGRLVSTFKQFEDNEPCPDELCLFYGKFHFHCAQPRCHHASDREDVLNLHTKDFHSFVDILEGFEFFDRNVNCRRLQCHNNKANRHFHCVRSRCDYSFVRHTTMMQHDKKHNGDVDELVSNKPLPPLVKKEVSNFIPIAPAPSWGNKTVVKAAGTFYPISTINNGRAGFHPSISVPSTINSALYSPSLATIASPNICTATNAQLLYPAITTNVPTAVPLSVLLQQKPGNQIPLPTWSALRAQMHYAIQENCARPFCKLKKKDHYHCLECNQAFSDPARLRSHIGKHGIKLERVDSGMRVHKPVSLVPKAETSFNDVPEDLSMPADEPENLSLSRSLGDEDGNDPNSERSSSDSDGPEDLSTNKPDIKASASLNLNPTAFSNILAGSKPFNNYYNSVNDTDDDNDSMDSEDLSPLRESRKRLMSGHSSESDHPIAKSRRLSASPERDDEGLTPQGYSRFKFTEDCGFENCVYRQSLTHYHCERQDCGYSFSNRTRVVQHTQRHERIDGITGDEFRQFRGNVDCPHPECEYGNRSSHFHCLLCSYVCMDAAQVLAHRKNHQKINKITSQGFQKYSGTEDCKMLTCTYYYKKQTHYHCMESGCTYVLLSPSQMAAHKMKHIRENI